MNREVFKEDRLELTKRLRQIRTNLGMTQERFAELFDISLTAYKKIETGENQITLDEMRVLHKKLNVSADYLLFGKRSEWEGAWETVENCSESDKMHLMLRLLAYFMLVKKEKYTSEEVLKEIDDMMESIKKDSEK